MVEMDDGEVLHILLIAEDEGLAEVYKLKLELDGYRVTVVDRKQTPNICRPFPSLIFVACGTVDREARRLLSDLRSNALTEHLPVVVLTELSEAELRERGVMLGARDYLVRAPHSRASAKGPTPSDLVADAIRGWSPEP